MMQTAQTLLKDVFGYDTFRPLQYDIIENVLQKNDSLVIMPTGGGKSLCYQLPALVFDGLTVVVSPLISLMKDQVGQLAEFGVGAVFLNSSLSYDQYRANTARVMRNEAKLLYLAPETLLMPKTLALLDSLKVECLTIDEAHCISEWGHDFRPEYRRLAEVRNRFPQAVCVALTATATPRVREDIKTTLKFDQSNEFIASFNRQNLLLQVTEKHDPLRQTVEFIEQFPQQSGLVYCFSRKQVDGLSGLLAAEGFSVKPYHAGLSEQDRRRNQELFIRDDVQIMVATVAFGMGINKPDIRFVLHYDLPQNIESYYQQIGRAGRDGLQAGCLLLFSYGDIHKVRFLIDRKPGRERRVARMHLDYLIGLLETDLCRRIPLLRYFGEEYQSAGCGMCDNCLNEPDKTVDITVPARKFLSCVKRTGELFGAGHIIDVLRGSHSRKVFKFGHDRLTTYSIGTEHSKKQWFYLSRQFLQKGLIFQDQQYGGLKLTHEAWKVLHNRKQVFGKINQEPVERHKVLKESRNYNQELFELLRQQRKVLAGKAGIPPYTIFPDASLIDMAAYFPQSRGSFLGMHGVGKVKLEHYGDDFIGLITRYCTDRQIDEIPKRQKMTNAPAAKTGKIHRHILVGEAYNTGKSVPELMVEYGVKHPTILNHLLKYLQEGHPLTRPGELLQLSTLDEARHKTVFMAFERLGTGRLGPVFAALNGSVNYDQLHLLRLVYLMRKT